MFFFPNPHGLLRADCSTASVSGWPGTVLRVGVPMFKVFLIENFQKCVSFLSVCIITMEAAFSDMVRLRDRYLIHYSKKRVKRGN